MSSEGTEREEKNMSIRIGRNIVDTRDWNTEDYDTVIKELRAERSRKAKAEELKERMIDLLNEARENSFDFVDKDFGNIWTAADVELYDNA